MDKLCADMYHAQQGVTAYINDMEAVSYYSCRSISNWENDLQTLKQLRHKRNYLAHDGSFNETLCTQEDIDWLADFRDRIIDRADPIAQMRQEAQRRLQEQHRAEAKVAERDTLSRQTEHKDSFSLGWVVARLMAALAFLFFFLVRFLLK